MMQGALLPDGKSSLTSLMAVEMTHHGVDADNAVVIGEEAVQHQLEILGISRPLTPADP